MDLISIVKDQWVIFLVIGLFFVAFIVISELAHRSGKKKKAIEAKSAVADQKDK
jgi:hypothetical protein